MKKTVKLISLILTVVMLFGVITSAGVITVSAEVKIINNLTIKAGESGPLRFTDPSGNPVSVKWKSSNKKVATVTESGTVTGVKAGTAIISTTWNGKEYGVKLTVTGSVKKSTAKKSTTKKISLSKTSALLLKGKKLTLKLKNAKASKVKWTAKNKKVATVKNGKVTAKGAGSTKVTAKYNKKSYKCTVRVYAKKTLGTKNVTESKNSAKIGGVSISFAPYALSDKTATTTLKKVSGLPKYGKANMKTYDFSLKNAKVSEDSPAELAIPYKVKSGKIPVAGYFNEKKQKWESVPCDYDGKNITIIADHFSLYGVGEVGSAKDYILFENKTTAEVMKGWVPKTPTMSGEEAVKIMAKAMNSADPIDEISDLAFDASNQLFDFTVNWAGNVVSALGFKNGFTLTLDNYSKLFAAIGFGFSFLTAVRYAMRGGKNNAAATAYQGYLSTITGLGFTWIGTRVASAAAFATTFIGFALNKGISDTLDANEQKWYDVYTTYYSRGGDGYRNMIQWRDTLAPILDDPDRTAEEKDAAIKNEVMNYSYELWKDPSAIAYIFGEKQTKSLKGGLNLALKDKLSENFQKQCYEGPVKIVREWYIKKTLREAEQQCQDARDALAKALNEEVEITFKDKSCKSGKTSVLKGWTVRWKNIPKRIKDKKNLRLTVKANGTVSTSYTMYAAIAYNIKPKVEICSPADRVVDTLKLTYKSKKPTFNIMTDKVKAYLESVTVSISKKSLTLNAGDTHTLSLKNALASGITWSSSDPKTATVNNGKVKALKNGSATITAKYNGKKYTCKVTVRSHYWKLTSSESKTVGYDNEVVTQKALYDTTPENPKPGTIYTLDSYTMTYNLQGYASNGSFSIKHTADSDCDWSKKHSGICSGETFSAIGAIETPADKYDESAPIELDMAISGSTGGHYCGDFDSCSLYYYRTRKNPDFDKYGLPKEDDHSDELYFSVSDTSGTKKTETGKIYAAYDAELGDVFYIVQRMGWGNSHVCYSIYKYQFV